MHVPGYLCIIVLHYQSINRFISDSVNEDKGHNLCPCSSFTLPEITMQYRHYSPITCLLHA